MDKVISFYAIGAGIVAVVTMIVTLLAKAKKAGKDEVKAEEGKQDAKNIETIAGVNSAGDRSNNSKLRDDDGFKRS